MIEKPPHGAACNGCGRCCEYELCAIAARLYRRLEGPCPALTPQPDGTKVCGLVVDPKAHSPARVRRWGEFDARRTARLLIGAGFGCDAVAEGETPNKAFIAEMLARCDKIGPEARQAMIVWDLA
jgi:hypothetical protein